ncbi:MAG TPA: hypothetical protein VFQ61_33975 [Polyangiaceae bacterium]|nr:hypothetical protein [Polyangiaceae bacterium]
MLRKTQIGKTLIGMLCMALGVSSLALACSSGSETDAGAMGGATNAGNSTGAKTNGGAANRGGGTGSGAEAGESNGEAGVGNEGNAAGSANQGGSVSRGGAGNGGAGNGGSAGTLVNGGATSGGSSTTSTGLSACDNGKDDDGDGLVDGLDPECTGPLDNQEDSFATGIPGDNRDPKWQDCFFDGNSGAGDDQCRYATGCLTGDLPADHADCTVSQACLDFCAPLTPNGCDCFGCCTIALDDGSTVDVLENSACSLANLDDEKACPRCVKSEQCGNNCGECELCPGKTAADLPASCKPPTSGTGGASGVGGAPSMGGATSSGGAANGGTSSRGGASNSGGATGTSPPPPSYTCDNGEQVCGAGMPGCETGYYCSLGCCLLSIR